jgi:hypothetical protein
MGGTNGVVCGVVSTIIELWFSWLNTSRSAFDGRPRTRFDDRSKFNEFGCFCGVETDDA